MGKLEKNSEERLQQLQNLQRAGWVLSDEEKKEMASLQRLAKEIDVNTRQTKDAIGKSVREREAKKQPPKEK